jgi:hypothetical protein
MKKVPPLFLLTLLLLVAPACRAQFSYFAGAYFGVSTLSGDARTDVSSSGAKFSSYKPENGATGVGFAGRHFNEFLSLMVSYGWNRNSIVLAAGETAVPGSAVSQAYRSNMHTVIGEGLLYFRPRSSRVRPYLSAGAGLAHIEAAAEASATISGRPPALPQTISQTGPAFRVAVGIDLFLTRHAALRYSFSETIQGNPFSKALTPPAPRNLANFQNWFGFVFYF